MDHPRPPAFTMMSPMPGMGAPIPLMMPPQKMPTDAASHLRAGGSQNFLYCYNPLMPMVPPPMRMYVPMMAPPMMVPMMPMAPPSVPIPLTIPTHKQIEDDVGPLDLSNKSKKNETFKIKTEPQTFKSNEKTSPSVKVESTYIIPTETMPYSAITCSSAKDEPKKPCYKKNMLKRYQGKLIYNGEMEMKYNNHWPIEYSMLVFQFYHTEYFTLPSNS